MDSTLFDDMLTVIYYLLLLINPIKKNGKNTAKEQEKWLCFPEIHFILPVKAVLQNHVVKE